MYIYKYSAHRLLLQRRRQRSSCGLTPVYIYTHIHIYGYVHIYKHIYIHVCTNENVYINCLPITSPTWPLHDIAITNIVWCMAHKREVG